MIETDRLLLKNWQVDDAEDYLTGMAASWIGTVPNPDHS